MLQSFHLGFQFLSHPSVTCKVEGSHLWLTDQQLKFQHFYNESNTKPPTWEENAFDSFLTLSSLQANTCSCLPQAHCQFLSAVRLKGLHCTQCEGQGQCSSARPQPVVGEAEGSQRQAQEAAAVQGVHLPIRDTTGLPTSQTSPSPKNTYQRVRFEEPAPIQTDLFMDNYHCTRLDAYLQTGIYAMHHNWREGRNTPNF